MNIIKSIQARWRNGQKGDVLVLTALLLPVLIGITGFTVDAGNCYYEKSRLQNAADAAAIAGAHAYVSSDKSLSTANDTADEYVTGKYRNLHADDDKNVDIDHEMKNGKDNASYYTVKLKKDVPLHFLALFVGDSTDVKAHSNAKIQYHAKAILPPYLFVFKRSLSNVNSIENPDTLDKKGQIITTFDGKVIYTDPSYNPNIEYSTQRHDLGALFTERARKEGMSVNEALAQGHSVYDPDTGDDTASGYWSKATLDSSYEYKSFPKWIQDEFAKKCDTYDQNYQSLNYQAIEKKPNHLQKYDSSNININIDKEIPGDINTPVIIQTPEHGSVININLNADTRRPVFIYCPGGSDSEQTMQVHMNLNGHTFRGVVWAPYINDEGVLINANNGVFSGSIIARSINLQGGRGTYRYEDFFGGSSGSSGGSGSSSVSPDISLVRDEDM